MYSFINIQLVVPAMLFSAAVSYSNTLLAKEKKLPNILLIVSDDHGKNDLVF